MITRTDIWPRLVMLLVIGAMLTACTGAPTPTATPTMIPAPTATSTAMPPATQVADEIEIALYWLVGETVQPEYRRIPRTPAVGTAALELLLAGPVDPGFGTALPTPAEVQSYPGREPDWGTAVRLLGLTIEDGVATANFSQELRAYGGGAARVQAIRAQITQTLLQFPTVDEVVIAIEGETETVLQP